MLTHILTLRPSRGALFTQEPLEESELDEELEEDRDDREDETEKISYSEE